MTMFFMCGITGYTGHKTAVPFLIDSLKTLEYRGYDSAGIAFTVGDGIKTVKSQGRISRLEELLAKNPDTRNIQSLCGIAHTRWATHGAPTDINSHPHTCGITTLVHNGIIENYREIIAMLSPDYELKSQTDTEPACALIDSEYSVSGQPVAAILSACKKLRGSYAFAVMFADRPGYIFAIRRDSPLIIGRASDGSMLASDIVALLGGAERFYRPENEIAVLSPDKIEFFNLDGTAAQVEPFEVSMNAEAARKGGYPHFMLKEIHEEPNTVKTTVGACLDNYRPAFTIPDSAFMCERVHIVACGTAMHAGLIFQNIMRRLARTEVTVWLASEFRYADPVIDGHDLVMLISQSGETADTVGAMRLAKARGATTVSVVNVSGSTVARESGSVIYTSAGPEIAVASTKAYQTQLAVLYLFTFEYAFRKGKLSAAHREKYCRYIHDVIPLVIAKAIENESDIKVLSEKYKACTDLFFIGRGIDKSLCDESSLKLKEVSYVHSEAYAAGELKHGTISLIEPGTPSVALMTDPEVAEKTGSNIKEVQSRGGETVIFAGAGIDVPECNDIIRLPECEPLFSPFAAAPVFQLFAYYMATVRGCDVDKPRNLAKSVTVE